MNDSFVFYRSWLDIIHEEYDDSTTISNLITAIVTYGITGEKTYPCEKMFLKQCYAQIDAAKKKHDIAVENGKRGGAPKGNQNARKQPKNNQKQPSVDLKQPNDNEHVYVNKNIHANYNNNVNANVASDSVSSLTEDGTEGKEEKLDWFDRLVRGDFDNDV